jgi:ASC-1-like (ASCH) protein
MTELVLHLKREYFDAIKSGKKKMEFRLRTPYWQKRLVNRKYDTIRLMCGYPKQDDMENQIVRRFKGYRPMIIKHPHFGKNPVRVFGIDVSARIVN